MSKAKYKKCYLVARDNIDSMRKVLIESDLKPESNLIRKLNNLLYNIEASLITMIDLVRDLEEKG